MPPAPAGHIHKQYISPAWIRDSPKYCRVLGILWMRAFKCQLGALVRNSDPQGIGKKTSPEMFPRKIMLHHSNDRRQNFYV